MAYITIPPSTSGSLPAWAAAQGSFITSLIPQITAVDYIKIGQYGLGTTAAVSAVTSANIEGGGLTAANAGVNTFGSPIFNVAKTGKWAISMYGKLAVPVVGRISFLGLTNVGGTHNVGVYSDQAVSATNYLMEIVGAGTTTGTSVAATAITATYKWFTLTGDATTISMYVGSVLVANTTTLTNLSDEPLELVVSNTIANDAIITAAVYGYVLPT